MAKKNRKKSMSATAIAAYLSLNVHIENEQGINFITMPIVHLTWLLLGTRFLAGWVAAFPTVTAKWGTVLVTTLSDNSLEYIFALLRLSMIGLRSLTWGMTGI